VSDLVRLGLWCALLAGGVAVCVLLVRLGLSATHARDLLHVGAGVWALGLGAWRSPFLPLALVAATAAATALVPAAARRSRTAARLVATFAGGDERWLGLTFYTLCFLAFTALGVGAGPFPAAAGLLALALGDGLGGLVGRAFGRHRYVALGKKKSFEGSLAVAAFAAAGVALAAAWYHAEAAPALVVAAGVVAALVEAVAPRASDNLLVAPAVWLCLRLGGAP
jgi:dolichol kinase